MTDYAAVLSQAEMNQFARIKALDVMGHTLSDFLQIAELRGYSREWAQQKWEFRKMGVA